MLSTILKALATAAFIAVLSEIAKRSTWLAAALVALPLATMLTVAFIATDAQKGGIAIANAFATKTFLLFWPGLVFFLLLLGAQRLGVGFWPSFGMAVAACFLSTWGFTVLLTSLGWIEGD
jgi:cobalamin synthase